MAALWETGCLSDKKRGFIFDEPQIESMIAPSDTGPVPEYLNMPD